MFKFVIRRMFFSLFVLVGVLVVVFFISSAIGDPARLMLPVDAPEAQYLALRNTLGLDDPLLQQFMRSVGGWVTGDFGNSLWQQAPAAEIVLQRLPATLMLSAVTLSISVPFAIFLGIMSARRPGSVWDRMLTTMALAGVSVADFWLALMLILVFAVDFQWFPTSGYGSFEYFVLPALTLAMRPTGRIAQVTRSAIIEEMQKQYAITARSKGASELRILFGHTLKNSLIPIVTIAGGEAASLLNGAVVVETIFGWPGIGSLFIQAIQQRDLPLIQASVVVVALLVISVNLLVDLSYGFIDTRVRRG
jgi:peptide/nickel transport system permease protein